jgi:hypothetical protein
MLNIHSLVFLRPDPCTRTALRIAQKLVETSHAIKKWDRQADNSMLLAETYRRMKDFNKVQLMDTYLAEAIDKLAELTCCQEQLEKGLEVLNPQFPKA